ncbi:MAG: tetratricopeptide repeat protein, partial [Cyanobacteria bacterium J06635_10]
QPDKAIPLLEKILQEANQIQDSYYKTEALTSIAEAYVKLKQPDKAIPLLEKTLQEANQIQHSYYKTRALISIAEAFVELDNWRLAFDASKKCTTDECKVDSCVKILKTWIEKNN